MENFSSSAKQKALIKITSFSVAVLFFLLSFFSGGAYKPFSEKSSADCILIFSVCVVILFFVFLFFTKFNPIKSEPVFFTLLIISAAALLSRLFLFPSASGDYNSFLADWIDQMRALDGVSALATPIGDYNMPYLYFLFIISKLPISSLFAIKMFSVIFDFVLAFSLTAIVSLYTKSDIAKLFSFSLCLFAPTVLTNSAFWAQCDSVYTAFCIWALYFALAKKPKLSVCFFALGFSFKIQTVFILPIIIFLILKDKIKIKHLLYFPAVFILTLIPALICGRSLYDTFSIYILQTQNYPSLSMNAASIWEFVPDSEFKYFGTAAVFLAGAAVLFLLTVLFEKRRFLDDILLFDTAFIICILMIFLLPRMHERYFYLAEVLSIVYAVLHKKRAFVCPIVLTTGFLSYFPFLFDFELIPLYILSAANGAVIIYLLYSLLKDINGNAVKETLK